MERKDFLTAAPKGCSLESCWTPRLTTGNNDMCKCRWLIAFVVVFATLNSLAYAETPKRKAILIDKTGTESEVLDLRVESKNYGYHDSTAILVQTGNRHD